MRNLSSAVHALASNVRLWLQADIPRGAHQSPLFTQLRTFGVPTSDMRGNGTDDSAGRRGLWIYTPGSAITSSLRRGMEPRRPAPMTRSFTDSATHDLIPGEPRRPRHDRPCIGHICCVAAARLSMLALSRNSRNLVASSHRPTTDEIAADWPYSNLFQTGF